MDQHLPPSPPHAPTPSKHHPKIAPLHTKPLKPPLASHPPAPELAVPPPLPEADSLAPLDAVGAAATAALDEDVDCDASVLAVTGEDEGVGVGDCVLVIGEGVLLPPTLALRLRLTPTLPQICCAKDRTSGGRCSC